VRPDRALLAGLGLVAAIGLALVLGAATPALWAAAFVLLLLAAAIDARRLRAIASPELQRELPAVIPVGVEREVGLRVSHTGRMPIEFDLHDGHPPHWPVRDLPRRVRLRPQYDAVLQYHVVPTERGHARFDGCELRLRSPWRLWTERRRVALAQPVRVYPNFAPLAALALVGAEQASRVMGAHLRRRRGEGTEFQQLREYRLGDSMRQIDWKASQRARKLISREYQDERNQQVLLVLDCGRRMLARDGGLSHFDHVLNAALMVAHIALRQGDSVGLLSADENPRFLPPQRGLAAVDRLLNAVYDLQPRAVATDYLEAATQLALRQPRRALVLLLTNARDEDVDDLLRAVQQLQKRHLVCVASLREQSLDDALQAPVRSLDDALRLGATAQYLEARDRAHQALRARGVDVLDVTCGALPRALVDHYLAVKRAARL
jgi:uncharacterized protein (DUF58 family)